MAIRVLQHGRRPFRGDPVLVVRLAARRRETTLSVNPIPVPQDRANLRRQCQGRHVITRGAFAVRIGLFQQLSRFAYRLGGAHKCHVRCIGLHAAPLEDAGAAKAERLHAPAPAVTVASASSASAYRQGVSAV